MTAYEDLVEWAKTRPWWQQQVLARLAAGQTLRGADFEAIADALLDEPPADPPGGWLGSMQQPADSAAPSVRLTAIREVANVNRLATDQQLTFGPSGVTVVYGNNGSGKSGYARLVKRLVRTRHRENVLPDIFTAGGGPQAACLDYEIGGEAKSAHLGTEPPADLSRVAYYDERCGDLYVTTEGEATYRPSTLRLLDDLIEVCDGVRAVIDQRLAANAGRRRALPDLSPDTRAGAFLGGLSGSTGDKVLGEACTAPSDAEARIDAARSEEARLRATDPTREARRLTALAADYDTVAAHLTTLDQRLGMAAEEALRHRSRLASDTRSAAEVASAASFDDEPLQGIGSGAWRALWAAARRFSESVAYPGSPFPVTGSGAHCVLCQHSLDDDAADRLGRFERFMTDDTEEQARRAADDLARARATLASTVVDTAAAAVALSRIETDDRALQGNASADLGVWADRKRALESDPPPEDAGAVPRDTAPLALRERAEALREQAGDIDPSRFEETVAALTTEQRELQAGLTLSGFSDDVRAERDRRREEALLKSARAQTDTRRASRASGELTSKHVTLLVQDRFSRESQELKVESVTLLGRGVRHGAVLHQPGFVGAVLDAELPHVLSEGEQTALGLAGFFVEAHLDTTRSALVLDDPVTSLDHLRRERVARRLVQFARDRQVVVFTHDVVFAGDLKRVAGEEGVDFTPRSVERRGAALVPGYCREDHPWSAQDAQTRLGTLKQDLVRIRKEQANWDGDTYEREVGVWAGRLSETWERFVSQDLAGALFDRGTQEVRPTMLKVIEQFSEEDNKVFQEAYKRVSRWATRHDKDASLNYVAPSVDDLEGELSVAQAWYDRVKKYKNKKN